MLRTTKYGETSIVLSAYTQLFGLQSYIVNGVRVLSRKGNNKSSFFQPGAVLDMVVYHNELKQLNRIKEYRWAFVFRNLFSDVLKNGIVQYMIELLTKCLKQPEHNADLFAFTEDCLLHLDSCNDRAMANFPAFFSIHLAYFFGFMPHDLNPSVFEDKIILFDLVEGQFSNQPPAHGYYLEKKYALLMAELMRAQQPVELSEIQSNADTRRGILEAMETYYSIHIQEFGKLKSLPVLKQITQ